jgi:dCMP deaminase
MNINRKNKQYMQLCFETARIFSTCGKKKYAAVLVDDNGHIVGIGYNGGPSGFAHCEDGGCPRFQEMSESGSSYDNCIAVHAEANALLHSDYSSNPSRLYINGPPCFSCAKLIANSTIKQVFYIEDESYREWEKVNTFLVNANIKTQEVKI